MPPTLGDISRESAVPMGVLTSSNLSFFSFSSSRTFSGSKGTGGKKEVAMSTEWRGRLCHHLLIHGMTPFLEEVDGDVWAWSQPLQMPPWLEQKLGHLLLAGGQPWRPQFLIVPQPWAMHTLVGVSVLMGDL